MVNAFFVKSETIDDLERDGNWIEISKSNGQLILVRFSNIENFSNSSSSFGRVELAETFFGMIRVVFFFFQTSDVAK